jgi:hypothetical protein
LYGRDFEVLRPRGIKWALRVPRVPIAATPVMRARGRVGLSIVIISIIWTIWVILIMIRVVIWTRSPSQLVSPDLLHPPTLIPDQMRGQIRVRVRVGRLFT